MSNGESTLPLVRGRAEWQALNQQRLTSELERIRGYLERAAGKRISGEGDPTTDMTATPTHGAETTVPDSASAVDTLSTKFRLSPFERDLLLLCAGVELDSRIAALCAAAHGDAGQRHPTFSLAMAVLPGAHWSALTPMATLRRWHLLRLRESSSLTNAPLALDEVVLHFLAGTPHMDERLATLSEPLPPPRALAPVHRTVAEQVLRVWTTAMPKGGRVPVVQLLGDVTGDKAGIAAAVSQALGLRPFALNASLLPTGPSEIDRMCREIEREGILSQHVFMLDCDDLDESDRARTDAIERLLERSLGALFVATRDRRPTKRDASVAFEVPRPTAEEQHVAWSNALGELANPMRESLEQLSSHFHLGANAVHAVASEAMARAPYEDNGALADALWNGCRLHARPRIEALAQRIESSARWDDLVLPEAQKQILRDIGAQVRQRATVYERWGFGGAGARGLGISALFSGASGTGKTMAADVIGTELRLDVYRIDLSAVVSKYIGETEKNLRRIFDEAEGGGAILLFDEADALFGKRSEVKDSHDRYANIEVSYLLQRMEAYRGLAILTTNLKGSLDTAFLRRIRFIVQFPFPDPVQRAEIWRRVFPSATPTEGLDAIRLAQLNVAGGNIKSIALNAAFLAADEGVPVRMAHVLRSARAEYAKLEKPLTDAEVRGWEE